MRKIGDLWVLGFEWLKPIFPDIGTASLGAAAVFFVRAFPSSNPDEWDLLMLIPSTVLGLSGLILRRLFKD